MTSFGYKRSARSALGQGARIRFLKTGLAKAEARQRRRSARMRNLPMRQQVSKMNYVDGYFDVVALHQLSNVADDTWADCELNPRQVTAVYGCMPVPRVGTGFADRNDRKIFMKNIKIRGRIKYPATDTLTAASQIATVRLLIVKDTQTNGVALSAENVIGVGNGSDGNATVSGDGAALSMYTSPGGWSRYKVFKDVTFKPPILTSIHDGTDAGLCEVSIPFKFNIKANCYVNFSGTTGAVDSVIDNSFHMIGACSGSVAPLLTYYVRTSFLDA